MNQEKKEKIMNLLIEFDRNNREFDTENNTLYVRATFGDWNELTVNILRVLK